MTCDARAGLSCIVPAYNEAARIGPVLSVVTAHPAITEVIVVDDGSSDGTAEVVAAGWPQIRLIRQHRNAGKTAAVAEGISRARGRYLMLIDADLDGLTVDHLTALIAPVAGGSAAMSISLRRNAPRLWHWIGVDYISGERVLERALIAPHVPRLSSLPRFGFEVFLNRLVLQAAAPVAIVRWPEVRNRLKMEKHGLVRGLTGDAAMIADILRTTGTREVLRQIVTLRRRRIAPVA